MSEVQILHAPPKWLVIGSMTQDTTFKKQKELPSIVAANARNPHEVSEYRFSYNISGLIHGDVAQLAEAIGLGPIQCGFESHRLHQAQWTMQL